MEKLFEFILNRQFLKKTDGTATVEAVLWMPVFIVIFGLIADASLLFYTQANLTRLVQDANRAYSVNLLESEDETEAYILARIGAGNVDDATSITTTVNDGVINTTLVVAAGHYMPIGFFNVLMNLDLTITSQHMKET